MNDVKIIGNLTRDPEIRSLPSGVTATTITIANNRKYRDKDGNDKEDVAFIKCVSFGNLADTIGKYFTKGKKILVEGHLRQDSWDDSNGNKRTEILIVIEKFHFIGCKE